MRMIFCIDDLDGILIMATIIFDYLSHHNLWIVTLVIYHGSYIFSYTMLFIVVYLYIISFRL